MFTLIEGFLSSNAVVLFDALSCSFSPIVADLCNELESSFFGILCIDVRLLLLVFKFDVYLVCDDESEFSIFTAGNSISSFLSINYKRRHFKIQFSVEKFDYLPK
jgi:hypothetical protein